MLVQLTKTRSRLNLGLYRGGKKADISDRKPSPCTSTTIGIFMSLLPTERNFDRHAATAQEEPQLFQAQPVPSLLGQ